MCRVRFPRRALLTTDNDNTGGIGMAQFRGTLEGSRQMVSRLGSKASGLVVTANGWNIGAEIVLSHVDGKDLVRVFKTSGSNALTGRELIAEFTN
ncbi:hypothetical protein ELTIGER69_86 [Mycobacterium phage ElTiger69]|nr:hypothetical protein ELTIGER69_86 [Mycobacterium phage ElTiger69]